MTEAKVGYLGPPGTFGEQAAIQFDSTHSFEALPSNAAVVAAVSDGTVVWGIVPVENTIEGGVNDSLDALVLHERVMICHELVLPVEQCLVAAPGSRLEDISVVTSHPQALAQCRSFLESNLPGARLEAALSTAGAVKTAVMTPGMAAIGTARAAEVYQGAILARGIQDVRHNKTRFVALAEKDAAPTGDDKTSIAFTVAHDRPGTLIGVLNELAERNLNLTRIESRPSREDLGIYIFLIDFQGHRSDPGVSEALAAVEAKAHYFRMLGSYPRFRERESTKPA